jgi:two-component system response regulator PilR (NtrC family)
MMQSKRSVLIVDDEADIRELLEITLSRMDLKVKCAANIAEARQLLTRHRFDICFSDLRLPDGNGIDLVKHINATYPDLPTAMITAYGNVEAATESLKAGAFDFVSKPVDLKILRNLVNTALKVSTRATRVHGADTGATGDELLGESEAIGEVRKTINKLARSQAPVYIKGESGVGKELAARMIHCNGPRSDGPFVPVNCGAIPTDLVESELFGHMKGSFTGASNDKDGLFQAADGGTLFLDEVADLPLHMQVKLLRVIQEKSVRPVGSNQEQLVDVRILSASHKDLHNLVESGEFRQDLYYRINVIELAMPSLRERTRDIPLLARHFLDRIGKDWGLEQAKLSEDAMATLGGYSFPGNVRELGNILERAVTLCDSNLIRSSDLQLPVDTRKIAAEMETETSGMPLEQLIDSVERKAILKALEETRYNKTAAAKKLGITFRALRYRLKKLGLE